MKWDDRFLKLAEHIASWSKDPSTKVGCVIVDNDNRIVSTGYNGFPRGLSDDTRLQDRDTKLEMILHAEINAMMYARGSLKGCTLYVWPMPPCSRCAAQIIQAGIKRVVAPKAEGRWVASCALGAGMFLEAGVDYD